MNPPLAERRHEPRFSCRLEAHCQPLGQLQPRPWQTEARDLSAGGVGLYMEGAAEAGAVWEVELRNPGRGTSCKRLMLVVHIREASGPTAALGGSFYTDLDELDLRALLE